jgi:hypothetical protein
MLDGLRAYELCKQLVVLYHAALATSNGKRSRQRARKPGRSRPVGSTADSDSEGSVHAAEPVVKQKRRRARRKARHPRASMVLVLPSEKSEVVNVYSTDDSEGGVEALLERRQLRRVRSL